MRALITGATGMIGSYLMERAAWHPYFSQVDGVHHTFDREEQPGLHYCDLADDIAVERLLLKLKPDVIFHLAGNPVIKDSCMPSYMHCANTIATHNLLEACRPGTKFIFASSHMVYGSSGGQFERTVRPETTYAITKFAAENLVKMYRDQKEKIDGISLRLVANCGANSRHGIIHDLVEKLSAKPETLEVFGFDPGSHKPFMYAGDTADAMLTAGVSKSLAGQSVYDLGNEHGITVKEIAKIVMDEMKISRPLFWSGNKHTWSGDQKFVISDSIAFKKRFPDWKPKHETSRAAIQAAVRDILQCKRKSALQVAAAT